MGEGHKTIFETLEVEKTLGWRAFRITEHGAGKTISENEIRTIFSASKNEKKYCLKGMPELSIEEAVLLEKALDHCRKNNFSEKNSAIESLCIAENIHLEQDQKEYLVKLLGWLTQSSGPVTGFLEDPNLEEIAVIGIGKNKPIFVYDSNFGWMKSNVYFASEKKLKETINSMASEIGRRVTTQNPLLNATLFDGSRMNACISPVAFSGTNFTIRKFRKKMFTPKNIVESGAFSYEQMAFLWLAMESNCSIVVCGNTGSGKTTLLNSLFCFVPENERIIISEECPEINIPHEHKINQSTLEEVGIGMKHLIENTLRMRPDIVIIGEVRNKDEASAFVDTLLAGQGKASYCTFHAQSGEEALARLQTLGVLGFDLGSIDIMITQKRASVFSNGNFFEKRICTEISEILIEKNSPVANKLSEYNFDKKEFEKINIGKKLTEKAGKTFGYNRKKTKEELISREKYLKKISCEDLEGFMHEIKEYHKRQSENGD